MSCVFRVAMIVGLGLCMGHATSALAQQEAPEIVSETLRNKIGLWKYCRDKGLLEAATTDKAIKQAQGELKLLPPPANKARADATGEAGQVGQFGVTRRDMTVFATLMATTPAELCKGWTEKD